MRSQNLYTYVGNNPINYIDPTGHIWFQVAGLLAGGLIGAAAQVVTNVIAGNDIGEGVAQAAAGGAVTGLLMTCGVPAPMACAAGSVTTTGLNEIQKYKSGELEETNYNVTRSLVKTVASGFTGYAFGSIGGTTMYNRGWFKPKYFSPAFTGKYAQKIYGTLFAGVATQGTISAVLEEKEFFEAVYDGFFLPENEIKTATATLSVASAQEDIVTATGSSANDTTNYSYAGMGGGGHMQPLPLVK